MLDFYCSHWSMYLQHVKEKRIKKIHFVLCLLEYVYSATWDSILIMSSSKEYGLKFL